jgi:hypothetical protein
MAFKFSFSYSENFGHNPQVPKNPNPSAREPEGDPAYRGYGWQSFEQGDINDIMKIVSAPADGSRGGHSIVTATFNDPSGGGNRKTGTITSYTGAALDIDAKNMSVALKNSLIPTA